jgi:hypothetical protein
MKTIFLVSEKEADLARTMEARLLALPPSSGVLFVGVSVDPATDIFPATYHIWVGCHRDYEEALMEPLVRVTLRDELAGVRALVHSRRGCVRDKAVDKPA